MRSELNNLENIDKYLSGEMSAAEKMAFEAQMDGDPALKSLVEDQQLFIQTVSRKAMMTEIKAVASTAAVGGAATSSGFFGNTFWVIASVVVVGGGAAATIYATSGNDDESKNQIAEATEISTEESNNLQENPGTINYEEAVSTSNEDEEQVEKTSSSVGESESTNNSAVTESPERNENPDVSMNATTEINDDPEMLVEATVDTEQDEETSDSDENDTENSEVAQNNENAEEKEAEIAQTESEEDRSAENLNIRKNADVEFKGGPAAMSEFLKKEVSYPGTARMEELEGTVEVKFFVDPEGKLYLQDYDCTSLNYNKETQKPLNGIQSLFKGDIKRDFEEKARHTLSVMKSWDPATDQYGNPKESELQIWYFRFDLDNGIMFYNSQDL